MTNVMKNEKGFTLLEIIVVLAVLGALAAMLSPVVFRYIDDANRARTQADVRTISTAIQRMYTDTGRWPYYVDGDGPTAYVSTTDVAFLSSSPTCAVASHMLSAAECLGTISATLPSGWSGKADTLVRHLVTNTPDGYLTSGPRAWKGPYTDTIPAADAWGNPYLVNINGAGNNYAVLVISAGANGNQAATTNVTAGGVGDDIFARVK
jgi:prepilin-type N-terminal cleavage/methylation domain-containing protein